MNNLLFVNVTYEVNEVWSNEISPRILQIVRQLAILNNIIKPAGSFVDRFFVIIKFCNKISVIIRFYIVYAYSIQVRLQILSHYGYIASVYNYKVD